MATYTGPTVSPVFVTGVMNDAWAQAVERTASARAAVDDLTPTPIRALSITPLEAPADLSVVLPSRQTVATPAAGSLEDQLTDLLRDFIDEHYPAVATPDAAAAWARVAASFSGDPLDQAALAIRDRVDSVWDVRGYSVPAEAREYQLRAHDLEASRIRAGSTRNTDMILKTHRKSVDLTQYEVVMRTQLEAIEAARAFLIGLVLALYDKAADEQVRLARFKEEMQASYWRYFQARVEANALELDRLILDKRIALDANLSSADRQAFVFRQLAQTALDECQSIASQASAAINRVSASADVGAIERTP